MADEIATGELHIPYAAAVLPTDGEPAPITEIKTESLVDGAEAPAEENEPSLLDVEKPPENDPYEEVGPSRDEPAESEEDKEKDPPEGTVEIEGYAVKLPEGVKPDNNEVVEFMKLAKETNVPQEAAQKFMDMYTEKVKGIVGFMTERDQKFREDLNKQWVAENRADPSFGGANYERTRKNIISLFRRFVPEKDMFSTTEKDGRMGLQEYLKASTSENAPPMFRFLASVADYVAESGAPPVAGGAGAPEVRPLAQRLVQNSDEYVKR